METREEKSQIKLDLTEKMTASLLVKMEPSLLGLFGQRCQDLHTTKSIEIRKMVLAWLKENQDKKLF